MHEPQSRRNSGASYAVWMPELREKAHPLRTKETSACQVDRRREPRTRIARPVYVQPADLAGEQFEEVRTMNNFSRDGLYFITERGSYCPGMQLHVIPAFGCLNLEYVGEVVRVEQLPAGEYGVAVWLLRIRSLAVNARTAAMSAFQSFAMTERTPSDLPRTDSNQQAVTEHEDAL